MPARAATPYPARPRPALPPLKAGPWIGGRHAEDTGPGDPKLARYAENLMPKDPYRASEYIGRPGRALIGEQAGSEGVRTGQLVTQFTKANGTTFTVKIVGGQFYTLNWGTGVWTEVLEASDFSGASITLSATARCYAVTYTDNLVVSDGVNTPWMWDGTTNGGLTKLTNAPVAYGRIAVYAAKLFFNKAAERTVIVWCEENQPNTGYEAGGYNNAWSLTQTDTDRLFAIMGSNESLDVFRQASNTSIFGAVTPQFQTTHTRESGSETIGTISPAAMVRHNKLIYFLDPQYRPCVRVPGAGTDEIWDDCADALLVLSPTGASSALGIYDPGTELILFAVPSVLATVPDTILVYNPKLARPQFVGVWTGFSVQAWGEVVDASGNPRLIHLDADGYSYLHGTRQGAIWDDDDSAGEPQAIRHAIESATLAYREDFEATFNRADIAFKAVTVSTANVSVLTPNGETDLQALAISGFQALWDLFNWDEATWASDTVDVHAAVGFEITGRWARVRIAHEAVGERFGVGNILLRGHQDANDPSVL